MSVRQTLAAAVRRVSHLPVVKTALYHPAVRSSLQTLPGFQALYGRGWDLLHPFDRINGTDTSGFIAAADLPSSLFDSKKSHCYAGSQPGIIRAALTKLPALKSLTFLDLGCGKGRPLLVASEFPFCHLVGVELSPTLAAEARANAAIFQRRYPRRVPVRVENADAGTFPLPAGNLVVFLYNPFGEEVIAQVVAAIEAKLAAEPSSLYVVYYNPVFGHCFDASRTLNRYFAALIPYTAEERGFGPDEADTVVIWQGGSNEPPLDGADAPIVVTKPSVRADVAG